MCSYCRHGFLTELVWSFPEAPQLVQEPGYDAPSEDQDIARHVLSVTLLDRVETSTLYCRTPRLHRQIYKD